ncbi:MAG: YceI family protein [Bacteroidales bacterium]|jgi:polyisoprenoid-binding protein YceI
MKKGTILLITAALIIGAQGFSQNYHVVAEKSILRWSGKKLGKNHVGKVSLKEGNFKLKGDLLTSGEFVIDMSSITNDDLTDPKMNDRLIGHLKSDDFFSVEKFPTATLTIKGSSKFVKDVAEVTADLTIKGITQPVAFKVKRIGNVYQSSVVFDRSLYDVRYGSGKFFEDLGDKAIDDMIPLDVTLVAVKK